MKTRTVKGPEENHSNTDIDARRVQQLLKLDKVEVSVGNLIFPFLCGTRSPETTGASSLSWNFRGPLGRYRKASRCFDPFFRLSGQGWLGVL